MKNLSKILLLLLLSIFLVAGSATAYPFIEVEGHVNTHAAIITDNKDGTSDFIGLEYTFTVSDSLFGAQMEFLSLEFETDVFASVGNLQFLQPTDWTSTEISSTGSVYELVYAGTPIELGQSLDFAMDVTMYNEALVDASYWQEGQIWAQSFFAGDTMGGGDGGSTSPAPEPATMLLLGSGLIGLGWVGRRKAKKGLKV